MSSDKASDALLPCPFCGEDAYMIKSELGEYHVSCPGDDKHSSFTIQPTEAEAVAAWNRRAPAPPSAVSVAELVDALEHADMNGIEYAKTTLEYLRDNPDNPDDHDCGTVPMRAILGLNEERERIRAILARARQPAASREKEGA